MKMAMWKRSLISVGVVEIAPGCSKNDGKRSLRIGWGSNRRNLTLQGYLSYTIV
jgi:hypothetical protein